MVYRIVKLRRRRENRTDYGARLGMLKSGKNRIAIRKTGRYIIMQVIKSKEAQDSIICSAHSSELVKHGWEEKANGSLKSLPAAYLTGYLLASKMKKIKEDEAIIDTGLARSTKGSRIYAGVKGLIDGGVNVPCSKEILPKEDRIKGNHMKNKIDTDKIKGNIK